MPAGTSLIADHISVSGLLLQVGTAGSPESFTTICNVEDLNLPTSATEILVTNVSDTWVRRVPTLLDMGKVSFKIWWVMEEPSHRNSAGGGAVAAGMRYLLVNKILRDWQVIYPDGNTATDAFQAYVTSFAITGKVGGAFEAQISLGTTGVPQLA